MSRFPFSAKQKYSRGSITLEKLQKNYILLCNLLDNMDSNARTIQHRSRTNNNDRGRGKKEKNDGDAFMRLVGFLANPTSSKH